jgi:hypothetical protein
MASLVRSTPNLKFRCTLSGLDSSSLAVITWCGDGLFSPKGQVNTNVINYLINKPPIYFGGAAYTWQLL